MKVLPFAALRFTIWSIISEMRSVAFSTLSAPYLNQYSLECSHEISGHVFDTNWVKSVRWACSFKVGVLSQHCSSSWDAAYYLHSFSYFTCTVRNGAARGILPGHYGTQKHNIYVLPLSGVPDTLQITNYILLPTRLNWPLCMLNIIMPPLAHGVPLVWYVEHRWYAVENVLSLSGVLDAS